MRKIYVDGGGFMNLVCVLDADAGHLDVRALKYSGETPTSHVFEFFAVYLALSWIKKRVERHQVVIFCDSLTVVNEAKNMSSWKVGDSQIDKIKNDCMELLNELRLTKDINIEWISRSRNPAGKTLDHIQKYAKLHFRQKKSSYLYKTKKGKR